MADSTRAGQPSRQLETCFHEQAESVLETHTDVLFLHVKEGLNDSKLLGLLHISNEDLTSHVKEGKEAGGCSL